MPYTLVSGQGFGGIRARHGARAVPTWGGHRDFANILPRRRSLYFPGSNYMTLCSSQVTVSAIYNAGVNTYSGLSLMAWWAMPARATAANLNGIVGASTNSAANGFGLCFASTNTVKLWVNSQSTATSNAISSAISNLSDWHFTVGTWDAGAASPTMRLFQDSGTSAADTGTLAAAATFPTAPLMLGNSVSGSAFGSANFANIYIADVAIWNRALTSGEVTTLYNSAVPYNILGDAGLTSGLLGWWRPGNAPGEYENSPNILDLHSGGFDLVRTGIGPVDFFGPSFAGYAP